MQRYVNIERFESLNVIGIVVGTLSVNRYNEMVSRLMRLAEQHDQVAYPFLVGKLNVPKLANFPGIEGFVLIGCERSCFIDTHVELQQKSEGLGVSIPDRDALRIRDFAEGERVGGGIHS